MLSLRILQTIYVTFAIISTFVVSPICLLYCRRLWQLRNLAYFRKRMVKLSLFAAVITNVQMLMQMVAEIPNVFPSLFHRFSASSLTHWHVYGGQMNFAASLIRVWFLFYKHHRDIQTISCQWTTKIEGDVVCHTNIPYPLCAISPLCHGLCICTFIRI